jgi:quercetin dioxygenase-like cupin family protein
MKTIALLGDPTFNESRSASEALLGDQHHRILRFCLKPDQVVPEHLAPPDSAAIMIVVSGTGLCRGGDGLEIPITAQDMVIFDPGEAHAIQALDQELVFIVILSGVAGDHEAVGSMVTPAEKKV